MVLVDMESIDLENEIKALDSFLEKNNFWWKRAACEQAQLTQEIFIEMLENMRKYPEYYGCVEN